MGNLSIGGFPDEGAQSVSVSLSGSTLTVNVDGHSDSVTLPTSDRASISGSITLPDALYGTYSDNAHSAYAASVVELGSQLQGDVTVFSSNIVSIIDNFSSAYSIQEITSLTSEPAYNINGSGTVTIYGGCAYSTSDPKIITPSTTSMGSISYKFDNGDLSSMSVSKIYLNHTSFFYVTGVTIN